MVVNSCRYFMVSVRVCLSQSYKSGMVIELGGTCTVNHTADSLCVRYIVLRFCVACNYSIYCEYERTILRIDVTNTTNWVFTNNRATMDIFGRQFSCSKPFWLQYNTYYSNPKYPAQSSQKYLTTMKNCTQLLKSCCSQLPLQVIFHLHNRQIAFVGLSGKVLVLSSERR